MSSSALFTAIILAALFGGPVWLVVGLCLMPWRSGIPHRKWLFLLVVPPIFSWCWGLCFAVKPGVRVAASWWIVAPLWGGLLLTLFAAVLVPLTIGRHFRFASFSLGMASASATFIASLLALMAVTGDYM